jgi:CubicO group peptidase (beta-lactamase class C family)
MIFFIRTLLIGLALSASFAGFAKADAALNAAVLPGARTGAINAPLSVFAILQNFGDGDAHNCKIVLDIAYSGDVPVSLNYQTTNAGNQLTGTINTPVTIAAGTAQNFLLEITASANIAARDIGFSFQCDEASATNFPGVNTVRITASTTALPDLIPIMVSATGDGVMRIDQPGGASALAAAVVNIGAQGDVRLRVDGGEYFWPVTYSLCETSNTGACLFAPTETLDISFAPDQTRTFSLFAKASNRLGIPFLPQLARTFLRMETLDGDTLAASSVALSAPKPAPDYTPLNLVAARDWAQANGARALLIMRNGETLLEAYWGNGGVNVVENIYSGTKSFSCALAAIARDDGLFDPDNYAWDAIDAWAPSGSAPQPEWKSQIRGRDLISLASALPQVTPAGFTQFSNTYMATINASQDTAPGQNALYGSAGFHGFAALFELKSGGQFISNTITGGLDPAQTVQTRVLDPIGAQVVSWQRDLRGKPNFAASARITARDWIKYGRLILDDGMWNGNQVLSKASVRRCKQYYTPAFGGYGLSFWLNRPVGESWSALDDSIPTDAERHLAQAGKIMPSGPDDAFAAWGFGNMQMHMVPSEDLVIVKFGGTGDQNPFFSALFDGAFDD